MHKSPFDRVEVFDDPVEVASAAAYRLVAALQTDSQVHSVCLTGGSGPQRLYALLATSPWREKIPWARTHWFIGDERFVPDSDERNNMKTARELLLDRCSSLDFIHPISTEGTPDIAARRYQDTLQSFYGATHLDPERPLFDVVLMGVGPDGHTASLFQNSPSPPGKAWVVGVREANVAPFVSRVSLTLPALAATRLMLFLATGKEKQSILTRIGAGDDFPASRAAIRGNALWLMDRAAAPEKLATDRQHLRAIIVMGVSGAGKSTIGKLLSKRMGWDFLDGDDLHSPANIEKMKHGMALDDDDRRPWLKSIAKTIDQRDSSAPTLVVACSALARRYRDVLIGARNDVRLIYLKGDRKLIYQRINARKNHFMTSNLLESQFDELEEPSPAEKAIVADVAAPPDDDVETIRRSLTHPT